ncbi:MAG: tetratricopeptide repeat protein [Dehalococcoidia bacterium]
MYRTSAAARTVFLLASAAALALTLLAAGCSSSEEPRPPAGDPPAQTSTVLAMTNDSIAFWERRIEADPYDFTAYNKLADLYLRRARQTGDVTDYSRAQTALEESLRILPSGNADARLQLAFVRVSLHDFRGGLDLASEALQELPGDPYGLGIVGDAQLALGRYDEAEATYLAMAKAAPGLGSFSRLAALHELRGDLQQAERSWRNAIDVDGGARPENSAWARSELGNFYLTHGRLDDAADAYDRALEAYPGYVAARAGQASIAAARQDYDRAIALFEDVIARHPLPDYVIALGDVYTASGRTAEAASQYALVDAIDQLYRASGVNTDLQTALFLADQDRDLDRSLRAARAAAEDRPGVASADALAWTLYKSGHLEEARAHAEEALRLGTQQPLYLYHAGMIAAAQGDASVARDYLGRALAINPRFHVLHAQEAAAMLKQLGGAL